MRMVWCTFQLVGFHRFVEAPEEVSYLSARHRHVFHFKVSIEVEHDNRDVEFHTLQRWCLEQFKSGELELDYKSCEMLAQDLINKLLKNNLYGSEIDTASGIRQRQFIVEVSEDGECGATYSRY